MLHVLIIFMHIFQCKLSTDIFSATPEEDHVVQTLPLMSNLKRMGNKDVFFFIFHAHTNDQNILNICTKYWLINGIIQKLKL